MKQIIENYAPLACLGKALRGGVILCSTGLLGGLACTLAFAKDVRPAKPNALTATKRYVYLPGGMVRDKATGLEWMRCALGQNWDAKTCQGQAKQFTYEEAAQAVNTINSARSMAGKSDWRVPSHRQLYSLVHCTLGTRPVEIDLEDGNPPIQQVCVVDGKVGPTLLPSAFPNLPGGAGSWFWSSSPQAGVADHAWFIHFFNGYVSPGYRANPYFVRLVRTAK
jgi:hypothetical protein